MLPELLQRIGDSIESDIGACDKLIQLLHHERDLLAERAFETLELLIQEKSDWLKKLEHSSVQRQAWLLESGLNSHSDPAAAFQSWVTENNQEHLGERWQLLKIRLDECKNANEVNGKLIYRGQATHQKLIGILRGQDHQTMLYTGKGLKRTTGQPAPLGKA
jgi:flagellar biosynthesis protein FlgN